MRSTITWHLLSTDGTHWDTSQCALMTCAFYGVFQSAFVLSLDSPKSKSGVCELSHIPVAMDMMEAHEKVCMGGSSKFVPHQNARYHFFVL